MNDGPLLVSACLLGHRCRWHGRTVRSATVKRYLEAHPGLEVIAVCPEMLGGLPCPRAPVKRRGDRVWETCEDKGQRREVTGPERTSEFRRGAGKALRRARDHRVRKAFLAKWSPSCDERGLFGRRLLAALPEGAITFTF